MTEGKAPQMPWLMSMGMPKCGTTTLAGLLDLQPCLAVHAQKEPDDFLHLEKGEVPSLSGYTVDADTRYLVDFSTMYGLPGNRTRVLENLSAIGALEDTRFILSLRDPAELARSFFDHMRARRGYDPVRDEAQIRADLAGALDFRSAIAELRQTVGADSLFLIKIDDLRTLEGQRAILAAISDWLGIPVEQPHHVISRNRQGSARRYVGALAPAIMAVRRSPLVRSMPAGLRQSLSRFVSEPATAPEVEFCLSEWTDAETVARSTAIYRASRTGPLSAQSRTGELAELIG